MPLLELDRAKNNPRTRVAIKLPGIALPITGILTSRLSISGGNEFSTPFESSGAKTLSQLVSSLSSIINIVSESVGSTFSVPPISLMSVAQSMKTWTGSKSPVFDINFLLVATRESDDIRVTIKKLLSTVYSTIDKAKAGNFYVPPLGYSVRSVDPANLVAEGTVSVDIGGYFRATQMVVLEVDFVLSQESIKSGAPLFAEARIRFTPFIMPTLEVMQGYLVT